MFISRGIAFILFAVIVLADAARAGDPATDPNAQRQAAAQAEKAEWDAATAKITYQNAAAPASGLTNAVEVKEKAGLMEASVLAAQALQPVVIKVAKDIAASAAKGKRIIVFAGNDAADTSLWQLFDARTTAMQNAFTSLNITETALLLRYKGISHKETPAKTTTNKLADQSVLLAATATAQALSKAFSYLRSDYTVGGIDLNKDSELLVSALAEESTSFVLLRPMQLPAANAAKDLYDSLTTLGGESTVQQTWLAVNKGRPDELKALKEKAKGKTEQDELEALAIDYTSAITTATATVAQYASMISAISSIAADNTFPLAQIIKQQALAQALADAPYALFLTMSASAGSYYTKKNLWTSIGFMPFYISGGVVVHYRLIDTKDSAIIKGGVLTYACSYRKASSITRKSPSSNCDGVDEK